MRRPAPASWFAALSLTSRLAIATSCRERPPLPATKDSLLILVPALPEAFDPFADSVGSGDIVYFNVFEPLLRSSPTGELEAVLAQSWDASKPGELSVRLKPNLRFHDGTPVGAKEVAASLEAARTSGSSVAVRLADVAEVRPGEGDTVLLRAASGASLTPQVLADVPIVKPAPGGIPGGTGAYR